MSKIKDKSYESGLLVFRRVVKLFIVTLLIGTMVCCNKNPSTGSIAETGNNSETDNNSETGNTQEKVKAEVLSNIGPTVSSGETGKTFLEIKRDNYTVVVEEPTMYVDNEARGRSGHMSHAMAEFAEGCFIDFNSNCSAEIWDGHSPSGWIEYRISVDAGKTYSAVRDLPYSVDSFNEGVYAISVEKAVGCDDGSIVAFCLRNDATEKNCCEPWATPTYIISKDGGTTWSEAKELSPYNGRVYDAVYHNGEIYVLMFCNEHFTGTSEEHVYRIYKSSDNGKSFKEHCVIPFDTLGRGYGAMIFDSDENLHVYAYNINCEDDIDHAISEDLGKSWTILDPCFVAKGVRNPQIALIDDVFILHGRGCETTGLVLYTSEDGSNWDRGTMIVEKPNATAYYSNNINLKDEKGNFLLVQYSDIYEGWARVNVKHLRIRIKK